MRSDIIALTSGLDGSLTDYLSSQALFVPTTPGAASPTLVSLHFGSGNTGNPSRPLAYASGEFTLVYGNCNSSTSVSIELLHVGA